jgi:NADPH2:quinone reductase
MAQSSVASEQATFPIPDGLDDAVAAAAWNPGMSAWLTFGWRCPLQPGQTVLILGATGVTGKLAVQAARHFGAGRVVAAGRNQKVLDLLPGLGADAVITLGQPADAVAAAFHAEGGEHGYDLVVDYLWGRPTEILLGRSTVATRIWGPNGSVCSRPVRWRARPSRCRVRCCAAPGWRSSAWARAPCRRPT